MTTAIGLRVTELFTHDGAISVHSARSRIVATHAYRDEAGTLPCEVVRFAPKESRRRRPDGAGGWTWNLNRTRRVPYRLADLVDAKLHVLYIVEGEKDVDKLWTLDIPAICNPERRGEVAQGVYRTPCSPNCGPCRAR